MLIGKEIWNYPSEHASCIYYRQDIGLEVCMACTAGPNVEV